MITVGGIGNNEGKAITSTTDYNKAANNNEILSQGKDRSSNNKVILSCNH